MNAAAFRKFICRACGLVYDEALGDEDSGLAAGTRFEDIPADWACPLCGVTKADFEPCDPAPVPLRAQAAPGMSRPARRLGAAAAGAARSCRPAREPVVVVGGGTAAWSVVERIRALDAERPITMVAACSADRYDKPRLSVAFRQGVAPEALPSEPAQAAAARLGVRLMAHTHAVGLDRSMRQLRTTRGTVAYGELILAHGARARSCPGLPDELTWRINDLTSYSRLRQTLSAMTAARRADAAALMSPSPLEVLLVGAGLVGCELANDLALAGHAVTLIEPADRPLPMATAEQSRDLLQAWTTLPIRFIGNRQVQAARRDATSGLIQLELRGAETIRGDVLISAIGLSTPTRLAQQAGLEWNDGIVVHPDDLSTGVAHLHALGDCISINGRAQRFIEPIRRQADVVAARICGLPVPHYDAAPPPIRVKTSSRPMTLAA